MPRSKPHARIENLVVAIWSAYIERVNGVDEFRVGAVTYVRMVQHPRTGHVMVAPFMKNIHFDGVALLGDLLRNPAHPKSVGGAHAVVCWGDEGTVEALVNSSIPEMPALFLEDPPAVVVALWKDILDRMSGKPEPIVAAPAHGQLVEEPGYMDWVDRHRAWLESNGGCNPARYPGVGIKQRPMLKAELHRKSWYPKRMLAEMVGHPEPVTLSALAEGLEFTWPDDDDDFADAWEAGMVFDVARSLGRHNELLTELIHTGAFGGKSYIRVNDLPKYLRGEDGKIIGKTKSDRYRATEERAKYLYRLPAGDWLERLIGTAQLAGTLL